MSSPPRRAARFKSSNTSFRPSRCRASNNNRSSNSFWIHHEDDPAVAARPWRARAFLWPGPCLLSLRVRASAGVCIIRPSISAALECEFFFQVKDLLSPTRRPPFVSQSLSRLHQHVEQQRRLGGDYSTSFPRCTSTVINYLKTHQSQIPVRKKFPVPRAGKSRRPLFLRGGAFLTCHW